MAQITLHLVDGRSLTMPAEGSAQVARRWLASQDSWIYAEFAEGIVAVRIDAIVTADIVD